MKVRIGYGLGVQGLADEATYASIVQQLEQLGFDSIWLAERVAGTTVDPIVGLAVAAGLTRKLKLGTGVIVLPGRNPAMVAKQIASLDRLSGGRLLVAFGSGARDVAEAQVFGIEDRERLGWLDEMMPLLKQLLTGEPVSHHGRRFNFENVAIRPAPIQQPLDLWLGGSGPQALRRVGRLADGWLPSLCTPAEARAGRETIQVAAAEAGRTIDPEHFGANLTYAQDGLSDSVVRGIRARRPDVDPATLIPDSPAVLREQVQRFVDVGSTKFVVRLAQEPASWPDALARLADAVLPLQT